MNAPRQPRRPGHLLAWLFSFLLAGCTGVPENITPVAGFELDRYLGRWYEIARLDHSFERGLTHVSAEYTLRPDGGVAVLNRGYDPEKQRWKEAEGRAYFVGDPSQARLKVSFFGPFYGGYNVVALDREQYAYSLVCGPTRSYLWILAREPRLEPGVLDGLLETARGLGFATGDLIFVSHDPPVDVGTP